MASIDNSDIIAKLIVRQGDLTDLPILDEGELGYALDAKRLFIGNDAVLDTATAGKTSFSFDVDLDLVEKYTIAVNQVIQTEGTDYTIVGDGRVVEFTTAPVPTGSTEEKTVRLEYNTEILTFTPEKIHGPVRSAPTNLPGSVTDEPIAIATVDTTYASSTEYDYKLTDGTSMRSGKINVVYNNGTFVITDNYVTTDPLALPHVFGGAIGTGGLFVLSYSTTSTESCDFKFIETSWPSI